MCGIFLFKGTSVSSEVLINASNSIAHRGPDVSTYYKVDDVFLAFHRLSINDLSYNGNQPFIDTTGNKFIICNGEIYNHAILRSNFWRYNSKSDCEVLVSLLAKYDIGETVKKLDAEYALVVYDQEKQKVFAARDPIGIRPLFYGLTETAGEIAFASEAKALAFCKKVFPFPPGHFYDGSKFVPYDLIHTQPENPNMNMEQALYGIAIHLTRAVEKRLHAGAPIGFLLSGGLDSSLVCAISATMLQEPIRTFSIGTATDAIDNAYAEKVAKHIGARHTVVSFTHDDVMECLDTVIKTLESWDVTTIRASIGMYLICKYIKENTDIRVLLTGEVSDELFGYKYTDFAPSPEAFQEEARKRIKELYMYDVLRADRCISAHGLEARVPFSDSKFVRHVMSIPANFKMNTQGIGKYLLRAAFRDHGLLPEEILYREKAAFSDAVGHSMVDNIKRFSELTISDKELERAQSEYEHCPPFSKEALLYRRIFDKHYPGRPAIIKDYWLPNREWEKCNVMDPSARMLPNYGKSGE